MAFFLSFLCLRHLFHLFEICITALVSSLAFAAFSCCWHAVTCTSFRSLSGIANIVTIANTSGCQCGGEGEDEERRRRGKESMMFEVEKERRTKAGIISIN